MSTFQITLTRKYVTTIKVEGQNEEQVYLRYMEGNLNGIYEEELEQMNVEHEEINITLHK
jgi:hypothetical protein